MSSVIDVIEGRARDLGGFAVRRVLPIAHRRTVGAFIFFDQLGPVRFKPGQGLDVRPHPHIGLATVTYLFAGRLLHRDSLGNVQPIEAGAVNWMTAGRGIVHSERSAPADRAAGHTLHGIQTWVWLPRDQEECEPAFAHYPADCLPQTESDGVRLRVIAGCAYGKRSPVATASETLYVEALLPAGGRLRVDAEHAERAAYAIDAPLVVDGQPFQPGCLLVLKPGREVVIEAPQTAARVLLLGGAPVDAERHLWWNFVSSSPGRIERAKTDWTAGRFPAVPGDAESIPLPAA
ncbi:MAG: pirin family protein [Gammaproteobacteria bacterium]|nr:pirin family protein [Gammaproteobacteria bacterium]